MDIQTYLARKRLTQAWFAAHVGVSLQALYRYMHEARVPQPPVMRRIMAVTGGLVQPNDFYTPERAQVPHISLPAVPLRAGGDRHASLVVSPNFRMRRGVRIRIFSR